MRNVLRLCFTLVLLSVGCFAQYKVPKCPQTFDQTIKASAVTITIPNDCGALHGTVGYSITGAPATMSAVLSGCVNNGGACSVLDTYTGTTTTTRKPIIDAYYDYFTLVPTWTGGTNVTFAVHSGLTIANGGSGTGTGLPDPGANGIVKRTALNTDTIAVAGTDYALPNANTTGTAGGLSANIAESQVTNLSTDLAAKVPTTTTVNGQALSSNVSITTITGNAGTASALAATPAQCSGGTPIATGIQANGTANCTTATASGLGDPGANGIVKRTALNTTTNATAGTDYALPNANTTGTAGGLSANIAESQVTSLTTDLAAKVPTSTTVNGHALSSNVTVTLNDVDSNWTDSGGTATYAGSVGISANQVVTNAATVGGWKCGAGTELATSAGFIGWICPATLTTAFFYIPPAGPASDTNGRPAIWTKDGTGNEVQTWGTFSDPASTITLTASGTLTNNDLVSFNSSGDGVDSGLAVSGVVKTAGTNTMNGTYNMSGATTVTVPTVAVDTNTVAAASSAFVLAQAASATPLVDAATAVVGTSTRFARGDHVHPLPTGFGCAYGGTTAGTAAAQTLTVSGIHATATAGDCIAFTSGFAGTSSTTLAVTPTGGSAWAAAALDKRTTSGVATLSAIDELSGGVYEAIYDGTEWVMLSTSGNLNSAGSLTANGLLTGNGANQVQGMSTFLVTAASGLVTKINNELVAGTGVSYIRGVTSQKTESGADASVLSVTPASAVGSYCATFNLSISAAAAAVVGWTMTYTDSNGNAQTPTNLALYQAGTATPALTFTTSVAGNYYGTNCFDVNNAGTAIVVKFTFSGTSITSKVSAMVERKQ